MKAKRDHASSWTALDLTAAIALAATIALAGFYLWEGARATLNSDSALKSVLSVVAAGEHRLVPHGWTFANGDILTTTPYTLLLPLQGLLGMSASTSAVATLICFLAMLAGMYYLARTLAPGAKVQALVSCALAASTLSAANLEFIANQGAYSLYAALALPLFALLARSPKGLWNVLPFLLAFALSSSNPKRAWVAVFAPALLALAASALFSSRTAVDNSRSRFVAMFRSSAAWMMLLGAVAGHLVYAFGIAPRIENFDAAANVKMASLERMLFVSRQLPGDWFEYFQVAGPWAALSVGGRIVQLGVWLVSCAVLVTPALALLSKNCSHRVKFAAWLTYALLSAGLVPLIVMDGLYWGAMEIRYATLGLLVGLAVLTVVAQQLLNEHRKPALAWIMCLLMAVALGSASAWPAKIAPDASDARGVSLRQRSELLRVLHSRQVGTAAASYWNSHVLSVLSSGAIMVSPVVYDNWWGPFPHHVPNVPLHGRGATEAVILEDGELSADGSAAMIDQLGEPRAKLKSGPFNIWVYPRGSIDKLFAVGNRFDHPVQPSQVSIQSSPAVPACSIDGCMVRLQVKNTGQTTLASAGRSPMRVGLRGVSADGKWVADLGRVYFKTPLQPGQSENLGSRIGPLPPGVVSIQACLMQEQVQWLCERTVISEGTTELDTPVDPASVGLELSGEGFSACRARPAGRCRTTLSLRNSGKLAIGGTSAKPLVIGYRAHRPATSGGGTVEGRIPLAKPLAPGAETHVPVELEPAETGLDFQICLLQEGVAWLCERTTSTAGLSAPVQPRR